MKFGGLEIKPIFNEHNSGYKREGYKQEGYDYYHRKGIGCELPKDYSLDDVFTLVIEYMDDEISCMSVEPVAQRSVGYTLVNTGRQRHAVFIIEGSSVSKNKHRADLVIYGVRNILSVELINGISSEAIERARQERPRPEECKPIIQLNRPIQLVSTVGIDAHISYDREASLKSSIEHMSDLCPLIKVLGFNAVEGYVKWNFIEYEKGKFDFSYYDSLIEYAARYGLKWFPLLIGGSSYALPDWYYESEGFTGFACLEHGEANDIPTIFNEHQTGPVSNYLYEFGKHYNGNENVQGVRLGPSGNYGESQYPATGNWGYKGRWQHMHIGWWAGDKDAPPKFRKFLKERYKNIEELNKAWKEEYLSFEDIETFLPYSALELRKRKDFTDWYVGEMDEWCERWAIWTREYLKSCDIYQSAGGWGFIEAGTDFTEQTRSMLKVNGGIRATNEDESYVLNFCITRMLSSAARFYGIDFGTEPASFTSARGLLGRLYNIMVNNGAHFFNYHSNLLLNDQGIDKWKKYAPLLDKRAYPDIEVAVFYPDTMTKLFDSTLRYLDGSAWFSQAIALRSKLDYDYCSERMVLDGALKNYKVLVFLSRYQDGELIEQQPLEEIDRWVRSGGTLIYSSVHHLGISTIEGDKAIFNRWLVGDTGEGRVIILSVDREPVSLGADAIQQALLHLDCLGNKTKTMLSLEKSEYVYASVLETGQLALLNFSFKTEMVVIEGLTPIKMEPVSIELVDLNS